VENQRKSFPENFLVLETVERVERNREIGRGESEIEGVDNQLSSSRGRIARSGWQLKEEPSSGGESNRRRHSPA